MSVRIRILSLFALAIILAGAGCGGDSLSLPAETDEPLYREGQQLRKQDRTQEALASYLKLIARRGDDQTPESHLEVGLIYLENIKNPIAAIYHFQKYLELEPNSHLAPRVLAQIDTAKREFARTLPAQPLESQAGQMDISDELERLRTVNNELKAEIATLRANGADSGPARQTPTFIANPEPASSPPPPITAVPGEEAAPITLAPSDTGSTPAPATGVPGESAPGGRPRSHIVVKGDTLYNLAVRFYGSGSRRRDIVAANRDLLQNENSPLKIGTELRIP